MKLCAVEVDVRMDAEQAVLQQLSALELNELKQVYVEVKLPEFTDDTKKDNALYLRCMIVRYLSSDTVVDWQRFFISGHLSKVSPRILK